MMTLFHRCLESEGSHKTEQMGIKIETHCQECEVMHKNKRTLCKKAQP